MHDHDISLRVTGALFDAFRKVDEGNASPRRSIGPITITVSREAGARGKSVAVEIGRLLGWPVYDREIMEKIAEKVRRPASHLEGVDERPANWLEECLTGLMTEYRVGATTYLKHLVGVVRGLGLLGHCVLVGRGANCILPPATTLRVRIVAKLSDRVKVTAERHASTDKEAARQVARIDHERNEFARANFHIDLATPDQYDLVLNTSRLSVAECARAVVEVLRLFEARNSGPRQLVTESASPVAAH
jgi:hypothetical protein